ncbi:hypothetical protein [Pleurocapsa sp. PCC 7319]|uniref:hypothetical protein n=1 Tax=Pleurocapsa sp. PCC 7319 TaxID=118161 RepID=UPI0004760D35|nr:hypothetical protein [Pleurocapsa sp. PCC 7319]
MNKLLKINIFHCLILSVVSLPTNYEMVVAETIDVKKISVKSNQAIKGQSGGSVDSQGCGFIAVTPNHQMNVEERIGYMRLTVQATGGQPTLLVLGPNLGDRFCVLGDEVSGLKPEISGVWEVGNYQIFVGDLLGEQHQFTLDISTDN